MMMKTIRSILVASDLSDGSDEVVRAAAALAALTGAELHLLHSFDLELSPYNPRGPELPNFENRIQAAELELKEQARRTVPASVKVASMEVVIYAAHRTIQECAQSLKVDLVVLGPHRRKSIGSAFLGSTADRVIRTVEVPCLIVRGPLSLPLRRVLVPFDLSNPARGALDVALEWAAAFRPGGGESPVHPEVVLLHVPPREFDVQGFTFDETVIAPELRREADDAIERAGTESVVHVRGEVRWGNTPADEILAMAEEEKIDLLVLATHGRGAVQRALIGSVASGVARRATCPVLLVPPTLWKS
jgi:nucleotide-binding universal stress UspA family protein